MIIWNAQDNKIGYAEHLELRAWKHITNLGHDNLKCNGKVVWGKDYTSKYEIKIPVEYNDRFDEIVEEIFAKYDNGEIEKDMLLGRPRWFEIGKNVKTDAFDIKKLVDNKVIRLYKRHVSTWFADKLSGRFNQNSARIHSFNDGKLIDMIPYMDEELKAVVEEIISQDFISTENFAYYVKCVNENLGLVLVNIWGIYNNDLLGKVKGGIYYVPAEEYENIKTRYRRSKDMILKHFQAQKPNEKIRGVHPVKIVSIESIEKVEAKKRIESFRKAIAKKTGKVNTPSNETETKVEPKTNVEGSNDNAEVKETPKNSFLSIIAKKIEKAKNEN